MRAIYARFNERDLDGVLTGLAPDVEWPRAWEGDHIRGHDAVREYWTRQWAEIQPRVDPIHFERLPDGRCRCRVAQTVRDFEDRILFDGEVTHTYTFAGDLVRRMEIETDQPSPAPAG